MAFLADGVYVGRHQTSYGFDVSRDPGPQHKNYEVTAGRQHHEMRTAEMNDIRGKLTNIESNSSDYLKLLNRYHELESEEKAERVSIQTAIKDGPDPTLNPKEQEKYKTDLAKLDQDISKTLNSNLDINTIEIEHPVKPVEEQPLESNPLARFMKPAEDWFESHVTKPVSETATSVTSNVSHWVDDQRELIENFGDQQGGVVKALAHTVSFQVGVQQGVVMGAKDAVVGVGKLAIGAGQLTSPYEWLVHPENNLGRLETTGTALKNMWLLSGSPVVGIPTRLPPQELVAAAWDGISQPYRDGDVAQGVGRGIFDIGSFFIGVGEANAAAKAGKVGSILERTGETTSALSKIDDVKKAEALKNVTKENVGKDVTTEASSKKAIGEEVASTKVKSGGVSALLKKAFDDPEEMLSALGSAPRIKRHNTAAWVTSRIKATDYQLRDLPFSEIRSQHSIDGPAKITTEKRAELFNQWLKNNKTSTRLSYEDLSNIVPSSGTLKVGEFNGKYITLDGAGRLEALRLAIAKNPQSPLTHIEVHTVRLTENEYTQLKKASDYFRDAHGNQLPTPVHDLAPYSGFPRLVLGTAMNTSKTFARDLISHIPENIRNRLPGFIYEDTPRVPSGEQFAPRRTSGEHE